MCPSARGVQNVFGGHASELPLQSTRQTPSPSGSLQARSGAHPLLHGSSQAPVSSVVDDEPAPEIASDALQIAPGAATEQSVGSSPTVQIESIVAAAH